MDAALMETPLNAKPLAAIPRQSLAAAVTDQLREKILRGELKVGAQLRQDVLATEFRVSKIPVREAFFHLEAEGLIKIVTNHGAIVSALSTDEIEQMFEVRAVLECFVLRHAVPNITEEDLLQGACKLEDYEKLIQAGTAAGRWSQWNWEFHSLFYARAERPVALSILKKLNTNCDRYTQMVLSFTGNIQHTCTTHRILLDAIRTRNADAACCALWQHLMEASRLLTEFIKYRPK
jgi:DNA-binding GntR family transcriptional regulator